MQQQAAARIGIVMSAAAALTFSAAGQSGSGANSSSSSSKDADVHTLLEQMQADLAKLRQENEAMRGEIDELRAATNEDWLTEARAQEIRGLVEDVLADADTRASLLQDGVMAGWLDHFFLASPDGRFMLQLEGQMQIRWIYNYRDRASGFLDPSNQEVDQHINGFENTRTRLTFRGHVFSPDWQYLIRSDFSRAAGTPAFTNQGTQLATGVGYLLDAWIRYNFTDNWSVRFGQFKLPFNREELVSSATQLAVERSLVNENMNIGRSQGIELAYTDDLSRFAFAYSDGASGSGAALNAALGNRTNTGALAMDTEYAFTARYERLLAGNWNQFADFTSPVGDEFGMLFGIAAHAQDSESTGVASPFGQSTTRHLGATADLSIEWGGANAFVGVIYHYIDAPGPGGAQTQIPGINQYLGVVVQAGVYVTTKWEVFVRAEYGQFWGDSGSPFDFPDLNLVTFGANYYIEGHDLKWTNDISIGISDVSIVFASDIAGFRAAPVDADQVVFRSQFQLLF